jgi:hypothetical protein
MDKTYRPSMQEQPFKLEWSNFGGGLVFRATQNPAMGKMGNLMPFGETVRVFADKGGWHQLSRGYDTPGMAELVDIVNFKYEKTADGIKLRQREGVAKVTTAAAHGTNFPYAVNDIGYFVSRDGTNYILTVCNSDLNYIASSTFTKIADLSSTRGRITIFNNYAMISDGKGLKYWNAYDFNVAKDANGYLLDTSYIYNGPELNIVQGLYSGAYTRAGQKHTFSYTTDTSKTTSVSKISFKLSKEGSPTGNATALIVSSANAVLATSGNVDVSTLTTTATWTEFTFSSAYAIVPGTSYYFCVSYSGGDVTNYIKVHTTLSFVSDGTFSVYTGSTWTDITTLDCHVKIYGGRIPYSDFSVVFKNRLWTNDNIAPNTLCFSNVNDPNDWTTTDAAGYIVCDGSYKIVGLAALQDILLIFMVQPRRILKLTGSSPSDFSVTTLIDGISTVSQDTIQAVENDILFVDRLGIFSAKAIAETGNIEAGLVSKPINGLILPYSAAASPALISGKSVADRQYWLGYTSTNVLVYDIELGIYTKYIFNLGTSITPTSFATLNGIIYVGASDGHVYNIDPTTPVWQDASANFTMYFKTGMEYLGMSQVKQNLWADAYVFGGSAGTFTFDLYKDLGSAAALSLTMSNIVSGTLTKNYKQANLEFTYIQVYAYGWTSSQGRIDVDRIILEGSLLSRF